MKRNRIFPLKLQPEMQIALRENVSQSTMIRYMRFGHLNVRSLKLLQEYEMVLGFHEIKVTEGVL